MVRFQVSRNGNTCGPFALALAVKDVFDSNPALVNQYPRLAELKNYDPQVFQVDSGPVTEQMGKQLRRLLSDAVSKDLSYKAQRFSAFVSFCTSCLSSQKIPDMEAFHKPNSDFISKLAEEWLIVKEKLTLNLLAAQWSFIKSDIVAMIDSDFPAKLMLAANQETSESAIKCLLGDVVNIANLAKLKYQYDYYKPLDFIDDQEQRKLIMTWFEELLLQLSILELSKETTDFHPALVKLSVINDHTINLVSRDQIDSNELLLSVANFFCKVNVFHTWDKIYNNYCNHLQDSDVMVTADELGVLANDWGVSVTIVIDKKTTFINTQAIRPIHVVLYNESKIHWEVEGNTRHPGYLLKESVGANEVVSLANIPYDQLLQTISSRIVAAYMVIEKRLSRQSTFPDDALQHFEQLKTITPYFTDLAKMSDFGWFEKLIKIANQAPDTVRDTITVIESYLKEITALISKYEAPNFVVNILPNALQEVITLRDLFFYIKISLHCYLFVLADGFEYYKEHKNFSCPQQITDAFVNKNFLADYLSLTEAIYISYQEVKGVLAEGRPINEIYTGKWFEANFYQSSLDNKLKLYQLMSKFLTDGLGYIKDLPMIDERIQGLKVILDSYRLTLISSQIIPINPDTTARFFSDQGIVLFTIPIIITRLGTLIRLLFDYKEFLHRFSISNAYVKSASANTHFFHVSQPSAPAFSRVNSQQPVPCKVAETPESSGFSAGRRSEPQ